MHSSMVVLRLALFTASADLDKAVAAITKGGFLSRRARSAFSTQRVYVEQSILAEFMSKFTAAVAALKNRRCRG